MDLLNVSRTEDFVVGERERCLRHGIKDDVTDWKKDNYFPFVCLPVEEFAHAPFTVVEDLPTPLKAKLVSASVCTRVAHA